MRDECPGQRLGRVFGTHRAERAALVSVLRGRSGPYYLGTQRIHVLESASTDPMGPYSFKADMLDPTSDNTWELDPNILQLNGKLYLLGTYYNAWIAVWRHPCSHST